MVANLNDSPIIVYPDYPATYNNTLNYPATDSSVKIADGWRNVVTPVYNPATQYLGPVFYDALNDVFTYPVVNYTTFEIQAQKMGNQTLVGQELSAQLVANAMMRDQQTILDPNVNLLNMAIFPFWVENFNYAIDTKAQYFDAFDNIQLYVCIANNVSTFQSPREVPGLWAQVVPDNVNFYPWHAPLQPNTYNIGSKVIFDGLNYESTINNNLYAPGIVLGEWLLIP